MPDASFILGLVGVPLGILPVVDTNRLPISFEMNDGAGPYTITLTGRHCHITCEFCADDEDYIPAPTITTWASEIEARLDASASALDFTVAYAQSTGLYTISAGANFDLTFAGLGDLSTPSGRAAALMGFTSNKTGAASYVSDRQARYVIFAGGNIEGKSRVKDDSPDLMTKVATSDDGRHSYGISGSRGAKRFDFDIQHQPKALVRTRHKTGGSNAIRACEFTYQELFEHCKGHEYFLVVDQSVGVLPLSLHKFRAEGAALMDDETCFRIEDERDDTWHVRFQTYVFGRT